MQTTKATTNEIYHIYNRGVEKRTIFLDDKDYLRFIHDLFEFNDQAPALNINYRFKSIDRVESMEVELRYINREPRKLLVELMVFCLMPNHFHFMVRQKVEGGITKFMRKLGTGYTNYFNQKYKRVGPLFQGKYKSIHITEEAHFIHLPYYIHANPLDILSPDWGNRGIIDHKKAMSFLETYRWSSLPDYIGIKNFPSVTQREFLHQFFAGAQGYKNDMTDWLREMDLKITQEVSLE